MSQQKILLIGGSGFISGTLARACTQAGHAVWAVTRGQRPMPPLVNAIQADRLDDQAFRRAIEQVPGPWDLVVDCVGYYPDDARQDVEVFRDQARQFVFLSTDFVYDPEARRFPQPVDSPCVLDDTYGGKKRRGELEFINGNTGQMKWTIFRACHVYGPGSLLGCLPAHGRDPKLLDRLRSGETLGLVGAGHFLQQPIYVEDLARLILSVLGNDRVSGKIYPAAGPDLIESREYYRIIAEYLGVELHIEERPIGDLRTQSDFAPFLCHRMYDLESLRRDGLACPATPIKTGLVEHAKSLA